MLHWIGMGRHAQDCKFHPVMIQVESPAIQDLQMPMLPANENFI